jgi:fermentation-respiration switch protein FrsA (DUF1100 family)
MERVYSFVQKEWNLPESRIVLFGQSIGSGPSVWMASQAPNLGGLILQSGYTSIRDLVAQEVGWFVKWVVWNRWNSKKIIKDVQCPILLMHGEKDDLIHPNHSRELANLTAKPCTLVMFKDTCHNYFDPSLVLKELDSYLRNIDKQTIKT